MHAHVQYPCTAADPVSAAAGVGCKDKFVAEQRSAMADDVDGDPVFLASSNFMMRRTTEQNPGLVFRDIKDFSVSSVPPYSPGTEPLYNFNATVFQLFVSMYF